ncbi:MAG TPA: 16S rRNA (guanine(966)-N(2))-methyltransferase RsmD [Sporolactobacillaceae bacterium]|nr:16S rRNA (guanine(966)-N(2))-methyltransferase RsmD [Sporolactobacillaceae bacterium]
MRAERVIYRRRSTMRIIAGEAHGRRLKAPRGLHTRPTSARARESIFSRLAVRMDLTGVRVLDIFAGSGSLGIESLSRGASFVNFIDSSRDAAAAIRDNLAQLGLADRARVIVSDVRRALAELGGSRETFDLVFVDAPFKDDMSAEVITLLGSLDLVAPGGWIVVEQSKRAPDAPVAPSDHERVLVATIGDHRIAFYRRPSAAPDDN